MGIRTLGPVSVLSAGDMSGNLTTLAIDMLSLPYGALEAIWTGANPAGTFSVDGSIQNVRSADLVTTWYPTGTSVNSPAGSASSTLINLNGVGFRWLRLSFTADPGSVGSLSVTAFAKAGGGS